MQIFPKKNNFKTRIAAGVFAFILIASVIAPVPARAGVDSALLTVRDIAWEVLKGFVVVAQKKMLDGFTNQTIKWIKGGAKGQPGFVQDFGGFLEDAVDQAAGQVLTDEIGRDLCSPFQVELKIMLLPEREFGERVKCSLSDIVENIEDFTRDFRNGGWQAWLKIQEPQNNVYGAYFLTLDVMKKKAKQAKESASTEVTSSGGFLGRKKCGIYDEQGNSRSGEISEADADTEIAKHDYDRDFRGASYDGGKWTKVCRIVTPGDTARERINQSLGWDSQWLVNSESVAAAIGTIIDAAINKVTEEGLAEAGKLVSGNKQNSNQIKNDTNKDAAEQLGDAIDNYKKYNEKIRIARKIIQIGADMAADLEQCDPENPDFAVMSAEREADVTTLDSLTKGLQDLLLKSSELQALRKKILKMPRLPSQSVFDAAAAGDESSIESVNRYRTKRDKFIEEEIQQYAVLTAEEKEGLTQEEQDALIIKKRQEVETEDAREKLAKDKLSALQEQAYAQIGPLARLNSRFDRLERRENRPPSQEGERIEQVGKNTLGALSLLLICFRQTVAEVNDLLGKLDINTGKYTTPDFMNTYDQYVLADKLLNVTLLLKKQDAGLVETLTASNVPVNTLISNLEEVGKRMMKQLPPLTYTLLQPAFGSKDTMAEIEQYKQQLLAKDPRIIATEVVTTENGKFRLNVTRQIDNPLNLTFPFDPNIDVVTGNTYGDPPIDPVDTALSEIRRILSETSPNMAPAELKRRMRWRDARRVLETRKAILDTLYNTAASQVRDEIDAENNITYAVIRGEGDISRLTNSYLDAAVKKADEIYDAHNVLPEDAEELIIAAIKVGQIRWSMQESEQIEAASQ